MTLHLNPCLIVTILDSPRDSLALDGLVHLVHVAVTSLQGGRVGRKEVTDTSHTRVSAHKIAR